jgi:hypothetical protein
MARQAGQASRAGGGAAASCVGRHEGQASPAFTGEMDRGLSRKEKAVRQVDPGRQRASRQGSGPLHEVDVGRVQKLS